MIFGSVCSGIEAATEAWAPLGWRAAFVSEIEPFPCHILHHRHGASRPMFMPEVEATTVAKERKARKAAIRAVAKLPETGVIPNFGDMNRFAEWPDAAIDVLVGGTPCQDYSVAGQRLGMAGSRGQLTLTYVEIAARYRPRWFVWENVPGVLSSNEGRDFARFLGDISGQSVAVPEGGWRNSGIIPGIPEAYGLAFRVLDAQYVRTRRFRRAVPQRRRRVFVVGYLGDWRRAAAVLFDRESLLGNSPPRREAGEEVAGCLSPGAHPGGFNGQDAYDNKLIPFGGNNTAGPIQVATAVNAHGGPAGRLDFESETFVAHALRGEGFDAREDGTGRGTPLGPVSFDTTQITSASNYSRPAPGDPCHPLAAGAHPPAVAFNWQSGGDCRGLEPQPVTMALQTPAVLTPWAVRRLTPVECERLQGFPDGHTLVPFNGKPAADGPRYRALGNSMAVNVMEWIGQRIALVDGIAEAAA